MSWLPARGILFIKADLLPNSAAGMPHRRVMVHHYRYEGDQTIFTMIDLLTHEILSREVQAHYATALAPAEVSQAMDLARADIGLQPLLAFAPTRLEARPIQYGSSDEPLFGHRVVHVLLLQDGNYLVNPRVLVDLTTATVILETNQPNRE